MTTLPAVPAASGPVNRVVPPNPKQAVLVVLGFTALLYLVELADVILPVDLDRWGILARSWSGLDGVIWAPLLHDGWSHLFSNTLPVVLFGFLAMAGGLGQWIAVTVTIWLVSGLGVWLTAPSGVVTVGASGIAFGWLAFLLVRGIFNRSLKQLAVAIVLFLYWGSTLLGVLPGNPQISWQGHLFGALAGVLTAWLTARANRGKGKVEQAGPAVGELPA
ncbi:rhomboid family intramembrane serine protease [Kibdelosporangium philippinense]|uniref:Rhomboid family intramembrane serine protease n=1 Tax=Kibdelosporangium philippinense TaxID=211113 RepID=A0ABS8ZGW5_9PSEU|nr:rhomboid family intramembrane serine protease [Kibdelosporangium philippinense]MCE7006564.1 rhomboid family intramembrane serine protease [Kibdelosporangium philippinense]